jgi:single-strand DNA-binding protein
MFQQVTIIGNLGADPEMRHMEDGTPVTNFSCATNRRWTNRAGEKQEETCWFRVSAFAKLGETANKYLSKGRSVLVQGELRPDANGGPRTWTAQDGTVRASFEITARTIRFLGKAEAEALAGSEQASSGQKEEDEIPF